MTASARWGWIVALVAGTGAALVLAFVLSFSSQESGFYERHFVWLFWLNVAVALLLMVVIVVVATRLLVRIRRGTFGSRLLIKLAGIFALVGLLPGLVIYTVSYQFVSRSIEAWFDVKVAGALDSGLALGKDTLETLASDLAGKASVAAERLADERGASLLTLERLREQIGASTVSLLAGNGQVLLSAGGGAAVGPPERPTAQLLSQARTAGSASAVESLDDEALAAGGSGPRVRALAVVPRTDITLVAADERFVMLVQPVPRGLAANALAVQAAYSEYQQRALARDSLRRMYVGTLTLTLILAVFAAVLLAILLGNQLARPLLLLADGVRQVAAGDLTAKPVFPSSDELGGLTRSFADMTAQVAEARGQVQRGMLQLEAARTRLQTILDTLTSGVIVFDREGRIDTVNPGATRILQRPLSAWRGRRMSEVPELQAFSERIEQRFELLATSPEAGERDQWQESFELTRANGATLTLLVRGATLPDVGAQAVTTQRAPHGLLAGGAAARRPAPVARLMVFDDITDNVSAQRSAAWAEVARRLAHEIKNPLTPIQLSAERLRHKLESRLEGAEQALLLRSVATIVNQVQAMQTLVNEFRDYARLPAAQLLPLDLNALAGEVLALYGQAMDNGLLVARLGPELPRILGDATQLRQVIHNLVQNALDAVADRPDGQVELITSVARGEHGELHAVRLTVIDNGPGFSEKVLKRAFEPYVTTKTKGTGLGLAVVKKIADEHGARLSAANLHAGDEADGPVTGARVSLSFSKFAVTPAGTAGGPDAIPAPVPGDATQVH